MARAVGGLLALIFGGITVAEGAILDLTRYTQHTEFLNLQVSKMGVYTFCFLGETISVHSLLYIGKIGAMNHRLFMEVGGTNIVLNTLPGFDAHKIFALLGTWVMVARQGMSVLLSDAGSGLARGYLWIANYVQAFLR